MTLMWRIPQQVGSGLTIHKPVAVSGLLNGCEAPRSMDQSSESSDESGSHLLVI